MFWYPERMPHLAGVAIGAFDDADFAKPGQSVWSLEMVDWLSLDDGIALIAKPSSAEAKDRA